MQNIIEKYQIKAKKSLWQNFLLDENILSQISQITEIKNQNILEIWPWFWALSEKLLQKNPSSLTLIELDKFMINILNDRIKNKDLNIVNTNFEIINEDVLKINPKFEKYKIIANIPYYITSPILFKFLYQVKNKPTEMIILMQKEVWERIISNKSSVLSLFIWKKSKIIKNIFVSKTSFFPQPKVDSILLHFVLNNDFNNINDKKFLIFIKSAFSNPRKKMLNNLEKSWYNKSDIFVKLKILWYTDNVRSEELKLNDFIYLLQN